MRTNVHRVLCTHPFIAAVPSCDSAMEEADDGVKSQRYQSRSDGPLVGDPVPRLSARDERHPLPFFIQRPGVSGDLVDMAVYGLSVKASIKAAFPGNDHGVDLLFVVISIGEYG